MRAVLASAVLAIASATTFQLVSNSGNKWAACRAQNLVAAEVTLENESAVIIALGGQTALIGSWYGNTYAQECLAARGSGSNLTVGLLSSCANTPVVCMTPPVQGISGVTGTVTSTTQTTTTTLTTFISISGTTTTTPTTLSLSTLTTQFATPPSSLASTVTSGTYYFYGTYTADEAPAVCEEYGMRLAYLDNADVSQCFTAATAYSINAWIAPETPTIFTGARISAQPLGTVINVESFDLIGDIGTSDNAGITTSDVICQAVTSGQFAYSMITMTGNSYDDATMVCSGTSNLAYYSPIINGAPISGITTTGQVIMWSNIATPAPATCATASYTSTTSTYSVNHLTMYTAAAFQCTSSLVTAGVLCSVPGSSLS